MSGAGSAAKVTTPGCCDSSLLLQGVLSQTPICLICFDSLLDTSETTLRPAGVVVWNKCGHLFHTECLTSIFGKFPSEVPHGKRRPIRQAAVSEDDIEDPDEEEDIGGPDDEERFAISSHCPQCPKCKQRDDKCSKAVPNSKEYCNPVRKVFFDTEPTGQGKPFPLVLAIPGQMTHQLDTVVIAKQLGVTVKDLRKQAGSLPPMDQELSKPWVEMATSIDKFNEKLTNMAHKILEDKIGCMLKTAAEALLGDIPLLGDCIEARRAQAKRLHDAKLQIANLKAELKDSKKEKEELEQLKARVKAVDGFDGMEALLEQRAKEIERLKMENLKLRWMAAESERRSANVQMAELSALRRAWKELCEGQGQKSQSKSSVEALKAHAGYWQGELSSAEVDSGAAIGRQRDVAAAKVKISTFLEPSPPRVGEPPEAIGDNDSTKAACGSPLLIDLEIKTDVVDRTAANDSEAQSRNLRRKRDRSEEAAARTSKRLR